MHGHLLDTCMAGREGQRMEAFTKLDEAKRLTVVEDGAPGELSIACALATASTSTAALSCCTSSRLGDPIGFRDSRYLYIAID